MADPGVGGWIGIAIAIFVVVAFVGYFVMKKFGAEGTRTGRYAGKDNTHIK